MKKILILGVSGMAGHVIFTYLNELNKYNLLGTTNNNSFGENTIKLDIYNKQNLNQIIDDFNPDFVINCIGVLINGSQNSPDNAIYSNSYFPHYLSKISDEKDFKLIHISTDCVFSGKGGKYVEDSVKDATDIYGLSKSLGEIVDDKNLTIRTSIIGPEIKEKGEGLFHWFLSQEGKIYGYRSNFWSGVTTLELAYFIDWILDKNFKGLVHLTNNEAISKYDLLALVAKIFNKKIIISDDKDYKCDKSFLNTNKELIFKVSSYQKMINDLKLFMISHLDFYKNYVFLRNEKS